MGRSLYSHSYAESRESKCKELEQDLEFLKRSLQLRKLKILIWDKEKIAVPLLINVELPPRGNHQNVDIRKRENILLVLHRTKYPDIAPRIYSDRTTFPRDGLSHLYVAEKNMPIPFCLVRGDFNEWYSNRLITDLILKVQNWLSDAANGNLVIDGGQFDPMRLESFRGNIIYDYDRLNKLVTNKQSYDEGENFTFLLLKENQRLKFHETKLIIPSYEILKTQSNIEEVKESFKPILEANTNQEISKEQKRLLFGAVIWQKDLEVNNHFPENLPNTLNEFIDFCLVYNIELSHLFGLIPYLKIDGIEEFPLILGVKRPLPIIGFNGTVEFFNFYLDFHEGAIIDNEIVENLHIRFQKHSQPLTLSKAQEVSGNKNSFGKTIVIGCGAVGSKVVTHLIREGSIADDILLLDKDEIEPHNIVRYGLLSDSIGKNKAMALRNEAKKLFKIDKNEINLIGFPFDGKLLFDMDKNKELIENTNWIFDFTASKAFENFIIKQVLPIKTRVARASITFGGKLGMLLIEGDNRNPRVDDIKVIIQSRYKNDNRISKWLNAELQISKKESTLINVGVGCNSETTVLNDDNITIFSSSFFKALKNENKNISDEFGIACLTHIEEEEKFSIETERILIKPLTIVHDKHSGWQIRLKAGIVEHMMSEMGRFSPNETGGVLIGIINNKTKCIHITDVILAPSDSEANEVCFVRGIDGLKNDVEDHKKLSGQTFGYIGEWHSHPLGPFGPSRTDIKTMKESKRAFANEGIRMPVLIIIATPHGIIPCIH